eukprot:CAMPEP_0116014120 /NCGR_PEP_ID=MMETSP0321-20121206/6105_1 /TAXON_ID=163516 /ORGANISM="Leptocylindrus danicus var. danicus, Strain B650" /LENGTH=1213 /DNA_ID=CAMNT_0003483745 /DNA_START=355 /DNA_END=3996 /DNA_ORIENTATION=-
MHIQEIVVDGFKSYAHRTVIAGFDPHFNAITGLNGSGKSNILDSICFVLGITNLSQVRAGNLSELVYKQGQAGVSKASVTIVFNNSDSSSSPVGYEQCPEVTVTRQVLIGGKSKYLINGRNSPANQVQNLFHSVQLNVNNPHFLIMQGRITKVLNMKPHEILGMIEETAGTRMYENKKVVALKTIEKKQLKVDEINSVLNEEITPTLERLRGEKQHYLKWSKNNADIERIERFVVASEYMNAESMLSANKEEVDAMEAERNGFCEQSEEFQAQIAAKKEEIKQISSRYNQEFEGAHKDAKKAEETYSKELVKATSAWQNSKTSAEQAKKDLNDAQEVVDECKRAIVTKEEEISTDSNDIEGRKAAAAEAEEALAKLKEDYQNMSAGISSSAENSSDMTLPDQISKAHNDANNADARAKQAKMKIDHLSKSVNSVQKEMKKEESSSKKLTAKKANAIKNVDEIKATLSNMKFNEDEFNALEEQKITMENEVSSLRDVVERLSAQLQGRLAFNYSDPVRGFDRSKVKGLVAKLVTVQGKENATALEVVAGGKLFQVVVDEAITGKALLNQGKLKRRVTIIPLDKITARRVPGAARDRAANMARQMGTTAHPAIELVGFDEEVRNAMEYVFGSSLVVDGMDAANKICDATKTRTVTLEGDVYDPSGTISGGSNKNLGTTLARLTDLAEKSKELRSAGKKLSNIESQWNNLESVAKSYGEMSDKLELAMAELSAVEKHLSQTSFGMLAEKFESMSQEVEAAKEEMVSMGEEKETKWALFNELKAKEEEFTRARESRLKDMEKDIAAAKKVATEASAAARDAESSSQRLLLELESLKEELVAAESAVIVAQKVVQDAEVAESKLLEKVGTNKEKYDHAKAALDELEKQMSECNAAMKALSKEKEKLTKQKEVAELEAKKLAVKVSQFHKERANAEKVVKSMIKKYPWIISEKDAFGVAGGDYDFEETDPVATGAQLKKLKSEQASLAKKINKKVMGMIEKAEGEYTELLRKRKVVENDKKKIQDVIEELDVKKKSELERTWLKVNRDFGSIFSTLLPGTSAKLEPPQGKQAWEGLEVKVAFGDVWKQSLSELSGGQRSLLALSLILSLLLFKPAPMYILDEVDAALDLSHTQNIGNMLKTHFSQSQFIVVSLKEGMFNNANVIFRTKFTDGVSTVSRTLGTGMSAKGRALADANRPSSASESRKRSNRRGSRADGIEN